MKKLSKNAIIGYPAGIITGITYGLNPLFAVPLMKNGAATESILFFRYFFAVLLLGLFLLLSRQSFKVSGKQIGVLLTLGLLYTASSVFLFEAYEYIASGLATTLVFLYPVLVAIIMVFLRVVPSWPVWLAIAATFGGVLIMTQSDGTQTINPTGVLLSIASACICTLHRHYQPQQGYCRYLQYIAHLLCAYGRGSGFHRENHQFRHCHHSWYHDRNRLAEPGRTCAVADHCFDGYAGHRFP